MISKFIRLEVCRDIAFGFSFSWLGLRVGGHCWLGLRVGGHCLEWLAVGLFRFLIYLALSPHLIIWSCEAVCPYGSRVCHGLPNRLWVAWVSRFKCRYLDTQLWQSLTHGDRCTWIYQRKCELICWGQNKRVPIVQTKCFMHCLEWKLLYFDWKFIDICTQ